MASLGGAEWSVDTWLVRTTFSNSCRTMTRQLDTHTHTHIYAHTHTYIHTHTHTYICTHTHIYTHTHTHIYAHTHIYTHTHTHICAHTHIQCMHTHTHTHIYAHAHTNIERKGGGRESGTQHLNLRPTHSTMLIWNHTVIIPLSYSLKPTIYIHTCTYTLRASYTLHGNTTHSRMTKHPGTAGDSNVAQCGTTCSPTEQPHTACSHMLAGCSRPETLTLVSHCDV